MINTLNDIGGLKMTTVKDYIRNMITILENINGQYDDHIETIIEWFDPDMDSEDDSKIFRVTADVNYGRTATASLSGNPESYDLGEDDIIANICVLDGNGKKIDQTDLSGNGAKDWKVYKISDMALDAIYRKMEENGYGPYDFTPSPILM